MDLYSLNLATLALYFQEFPSLKSSKVVGATKDMLYKIWKA